MKFTAGAFVALLTVQAVGGQGILGSFFGGNKKAEAKTEPVSASVPVANAKPVVHRRLSAASSAVSFPTQTFYVPMPEHDVFHNMFKVINSYSYNDGTPIVNGDMISLISFAISTDNTIIWYDHWEDGFEADITNPTMADTEIWGDGDASNGCRPDLDVCSDATDVLMAGDSFVVQTAVPMPRQADNWALHGIKKDGGDKIMTNFPITMTRGEYASSPGSVLAGAVEVHDTSLWGTSYEAPIGTDLDISTNAFQFVHMFVMAQKDGTVVTYPGGTTVLNQGQSVSFSVEQGAPVTASHPVQVDICAGDIGSYYEMRWFSLLPTESWSDDYMTPVGDSHANTKLVLYNPADAPITAVLEWRHEDGSYLTENVSMPAKSSSFSRVIPTGSGARVTSTGNTFVALSFTDTDVYVGDEYLHGQFFDWGFPLIPVNKMTPQVLVGWGYGCTSNDCQGKTERSAVWVSPIEDADIYIDYQNTGSGYEKITLDKLQGAMIRDTNDHDMSGAYIFATQVATGPNGTPVDFVSAWGQDPAVSRSSQSISLDLGTVVLPFSALRVSSSVDKPVAYPGDTLTYTITTQNVGQVDVPTGDYSWHNPSMFQTKYIEGTTEYSSDGGLTFFSVADDTDSDTPFPLDEFGLPSKGSLPRRGGVHVVKFSVTVDPEKLHSDQIINKGWITPNYGPTLPYEDPTKILFRTGIKVDNIVYLGDNGKLGCNQAVELVTDVLDSVVTYCFTVTNTGSTYLDDITLTNPKLGIDTGVYDIPKLAPDESMLVTFQGIITADLRNHVKAIGNPVFHGGSDIPGLPDVAAQDPSDVATVPDDPSIQIDNTVYLGDRGAQECAVAGVEIVYGDLDADVTYCFKVTNTGNVHLTNIKITNPILDGYVRDDLIDLAPGKSTTIALTSTITGDLQNMATATGTPSKPNGTPIPNAADVSSSDPSEVAKFLDTDDRSTTKDPETCMQTNWEDAGNSQNLVCRAKEVFLEDISSARMSCNEGEMVTVDIMANIHFNAARYDPGWYVALDGGDALVGTCKLNALTQGNDYIVTDSLNSDDVVGRVAWNDDFKGGNDKCGDVLMDGGGGANIAVPFLESTEIKCVDDNSDGNLDFSVCFSWRVKGKDGFCTLSRDDPDTVGDQADLYPGTPSKCFCARYDVPQITVIKPTSDDHVSPC